MSRTSVSHTTTRRSESHRGLANSTAAEAWIATKSHSTSKYTASIRVHFGSLSRSRVISQRTVNATTTTIHSLNPLAMEEIWSTRSSDIDWTAV